MFRTLLSPSRLRFLSNSHSPVPTTCRFRIFTAVSSMADKPPTEGHNTSTSSTTTTHINRLVAERSPCLLQHAHNPFKLIGIHGAKKLSSKLGKETFLSSFQVLSSMALLNFMLIVDLLCGVDCVVVVVKKEGEQAEEGERLSLIFGLKFT
ncbi:hypothetical protein LINPERPRIM_LOCUS14440 [Linum perenne]